MGTAVSIVEVGPRDGFQSVKPWIETEDKVAIIRALLDAGLSAIEATSFISPKAIPQMRDAPEVIAALRDYPGGAEKLYALVPNRMGAERAVGAGVRNAAMVISASPDHNASNVNKTPAESLEELRRVRSDFPDLRVKLDLATAFGCPFRGAVTLDEITLVLDSAAALGVEDFCLCDTIGVAFPSQVSCLLDRLLPRYRGVRWSVHLHNTRGMALANTLAALGKGITTFETAVAGLGGCPFAPGASGNLATEDLVYLLDEMNLSCGVDLGQIIRVSETITGKLGLCCDSKINAVTAHKVFPRN